MSASNTVRVSASPSQVRAWAEAEGLIKAGQRGRLGAPVIKAYNAKHGVKHTESKYAKTVKVTAKPAKGRKVTRTVLIPEVRAWASDNGFKVGPRGTLSAEVLSAYVLRSEG
jgi:hypothetical protein